MLHGKSVTCRRFLLDIGPDKGLCEGKDRRLCLHKESPPPRKSYLVMPLGWLDSFAALN